MKFCIFSRAKLPNGGCPTMSCLSTKFRIPRPAKSRKPHCGICLQTIACPGLKWPSLRPVGRWLHLKILRPVGRWLHLKILRPVGRWLFEMREVGKPVPRKKNSSHLKHTPPCVIASRRRRRGNPCFVRHPPALLCLSSGLLPATLRARSQ